MAKTFNEKEKSLESICKSNCVGFDWEKTPWYDREYLRGEFKRILTSRNFEGTGKSLFDIAEVVDYGIVRASQLGSYINTSEYDVAHYGTHLLQGKKYYLCIKYQEYDV